MYKSSCSKSIKKSLHKKSSNNILIYYFPFFVEFDLSAKWRMINFRVVSKIFFHVSSKKIIQQPSTPRVILSPILSLSHYFPLSQWELSAPHAPYASMLCCCGGCPTLFPARPAQSNSNCRRRRRLRSTVGFILRIVRVFWSRISRERS